MANPFHIALGDLAGKVPGGVSGNYCLTIGEVEDGMLDELAPGNYVQYAQDIDITGVNFIRFWIMGVLPKGWVLIFLVDGNGQGEFRWALSETTFLPVSINVSGINGVHTFAFHLVREP